MDTKPAETRSGGVLLTQKVQVTFRIVGRDPVTVEGGEGESILEVALAHDVPLEHNCGGNCACTTCHVIVKEGMDRLSEMAEDEEDRLDKARGLTLTSRLGCQARLHGDVVVEIPH
ncbi:MAG: 2Fe-2S iron-sulfur cluster binding domain-containing protein [Nitrospirae bacterium]|nr:2Fe-2S iron-sulfur cluster binding domain-containing protein [Nitrospirota bacterium]